MAPFMDARGRLDAAAFFLAAAWAGLPLGAAFLPLRPCGNRNGDGGKGGVQALAVGGWAGGGERRQRARDAAHTLGFTSSSSASPLSLSLSLLLLLLLLLLTAAAAAAALPPPPPPPPPPSLSLSLELSLEEGSRVRGALPPCRKRTAAATFTGATGSESLSLSLMACRRARAGGGCNAACPRLPRGQRTIPLTRNLLTGLLRRGPRGHGPAPPPAVQQGRAGARTTTQSRWVRPTRGARAAVLHP
jgi:hypothetical protein